MKLPYWSGSPAKLRRRTVELGGLNYTQDVREGELEDSRGLSCGSWPCLTQRPGRRLVRRTENCQSFYAWDKLVTVEGSRLCYGGQVVGTLTPGEKRFAVVNTKLCIFPDKKYLDLTTREMGELQAQAANPENMTAVFTGRTLRMERESVAARFVDVAEVLVPTSLGVKANKDRDLEGTDYFLEAFYDLEWDGERGRWTDSSGGEPKRDAVYLSGAAAAAGLKGKKVLLKDTGISGGYALAMKRMKVVLSYAGGGKYVTHRTVEEDYGPYAVQGLYGVVEDAYTVDETGLYNGEYSAERFSIRVKVVDAATAGPGLEKLFAPGDRVRLSGCTDLPENDREDLRVESVTGQTITFTLGEEEVFTPGEETGRVVLCRPVPDLDFICESGNRLFGCSSGDQTIYASALGDPRNFRVFDGGPGDSYRVQVGTDGDFTGCRAYGGAVLLWKEDCLHRLVGAYPAAFEVRTDYIAGVQAGSAGSMAVVNETLYYKGRDGVYAYSGGVPRLISTALGQVRYDKAAAGSDGTRYYISMRRRDTGAWELLTYDLGRKLWMKEDALEVRAFAALDGTVYQLREDGVYALGGEADDPAAPLAWEAVFAPFFEDTHRRKYPSRLLLRLELEPGSWAEVQLARDDGPFRPVWTSRDCHALTAAVPIRPGRCDRYRLRLKGEGRCLVRSLEREFSLGGVR